MGEPWAVTGLEIPWKVDYSVIGLLSPSSGSQSLFSNTQPSSPEFRLEIARPIELTGIVKVIELLSAPEFDHGETQSL